MMNVGVATDLMNNLKYDGALSNIINWIFLKDIFVINPLTEINHESNHKAL